ncbi:NAD(P)H-hydrate dehydratase [Zeaxanthinibacter enoshimensis]|uniref:Bifunctional NAD(P)H-hydrate repair enzyme n=1 Tax=Zeaxanthinibacter enoshimensis TaxID=392009 RepID=A0A4R6TNW8_9FLAO|nr:NAD(P)H-hydrate dehydratase [Zeaxanthinibacter enoshimensis]TDQ31041.1 hydroxyethylthiazole kinase-like uncharacterized protein yjeF/hydroxyethylthiazole kinase-like uncharacterized protein yjeF [Zeaxanthinibacter enoshimensis]
MKIYTAQQIYDADKFTIKKQQITSAMLMERAATELFNWIHERLQGAPVLIHIFCGIGNNGGDGLVLARHLQDHGYHLKVYIVDYSKNRSEDFLINLERLKERKVWPTVIEKGSTLPEIGNEDIVVEAIFGLGLSRPPADWVLQLFDYLNTSKAFKVSVDIPSGLYTDRVTPEQQAVEADFVLTFQAPKLIFFLPGTGKYIGNWAALDIGLDQEFLAGRETTYDFVVQSELRPLYREREKFTHKGTYGHSLIIGGSYGKIGAVHLSARACLHSGSGLVTAYVPSCGYIPLQTAIPEIMLLTDPAEQQIEKLEFELEPSVIGMGIGMGTSEATAEAFSAFLKRNKIPLVLDADALNLLSADKELLGDIPPGSVLTPHPGELKRLIGSWEDDFDKLEKAHAFSKKYDCILVIKGSHTFTIYGEKGYINSTGNPGMATGGSGDVLTGVITALIAQGYEPLQATVLGVFLHGRAGDIAASEWGYEALSATLIIEKMGQAFRSLVSEPGKTGESKGGK